jgi:hypothetical protein
VTWSTPDGDGGDMTLREYIVDMLVDQELDADLVACIATFHAKRFRETTDVALRIVDEEVAKLTAVLARVGLTLPCMNS